MLEYDGIVVEVLMNDKFTTVLGNNDITFYAKNNEGHPSMAKGDSHLDAVVTMLGEYLGNGQIGPRTSVYPGVKQSVLNGTVDSDIIFSGSQYHALNTIQYLSKCFTFWSVIGCPVITSDPVPYEDGDYVFDDVEGPYDGIEMPFFSGVVKRDTFDGYSNKANVLSSGLTERSAQDNTGIASYGEVHSRVINTKLSSTIGQDVADARLAQMSDIRMPYVINCVGYRSDIHVGFGVKVRLNEDDMSTPVETVCTMKEYWWTDNIEKYKVPTNYIIYNLVPHDFTGEARLPRPFIPKKQRQTLKLASLDGGLLQEY
jgi:hypothetical protein